MSKKDYANKRDFFIYQGGVFMSELTEKLIELINNNYTANQICATLNITNRELYNYLTMLRARGFVYANKYYDNGEIAYTKIVNKQKLIEYKLKESINVITNHDGTSFKALLISDIQYGNSNLREDLIDSAFNYCIKNDIHIIICAGDILDGSFSSSEQSITDLYSQATYFIKHYPLDKNIITISSLGDHDYSLLKHKGIDVGELISNYRNDVVTLGYEGSDINIKNDQMFLCHRTGSLDYSSCPPIIIQGHYHEYSLKESRLGNVTITLPTISNMTSSIPSIVEMDATCKQCYFADVEFKQLLITNGCGVINRVSYDFASRFPRKNKNIDNTEEYPTMEKKIEVNNPVRVRKTQIEKFNERLAKKKGSN